MFDEAFKPLKTYDTLYYKLDSRIPSNKKESIKSRFQDYCSDLEEWHDKVVSNLEKEGDVLLDYVRQYRRNAKDDDEIWELIKKLFERDMYLTVAGYWSDEAGFYTVKLLHTIQDLYVISYPETMGLSSLSLRMSDGLVRNVPDLIKEFTKGAGVNKLEGALKVVKAW